MQKTTVGSIGLIAGLISLNLYAQSPELIDFNQLYQNGQYAKAINTLMELNITEKGEKEYLLGQCYFKLQEFDKALIKFEEAIREKNTHEDLLYQYGQSLYAANELKKARVAFSQSAQRKFNPSASTYYMAHISQILEDFSEAQKNYSAIIKDADADQKIKQIARFQLAETILTVVREKNQTQDEKQKYIDKYVLGLMRQALNTDKTSSVAPEIEARIADIEKEFNLDPNLLNNGRRVSSKRFNAYVLQKIKFDDNIALTNEENNTTQSQKESFIFESEAYAKYDFVLKKKFILSPEIRLNFIQNSDQDTPEVYQNDTYSLNANLRSKYEHMMFESPSSFIIDLEYTKNNKDWNQQHKREPYAKAFSLIAGEIFRYFRLGDSSIKIKFKDYKGENATISNRTSSLIADQIISFSNQNLLVFYFEADFINNYNNQTSNTNTYLTRFDYIVPDIRPTFTLDIALTSTITDTKEQKINRGTEFSMSPSIDLSKQVSEKFKIAMNYEYTKSNSKQAEYKYTKNVFSTEFRYSF